MSTLKQHIEKKLLKQIAEGNEQAFRTLFDAYHGHLFNYIYGIAKSRQVAEELMMDVFLKIWLGKELIVQIENFDSFLFRVAHNKSIDFLRAAAKDPEFKNLLFAAMHKDSSAWADSQVLLREYESRLRDAVSLLSPQRKKVYQLSREQDMNHDQIAEHLQLSKHTVNNHIVEAQRFIRHFFLKTSM